MQIDKWRNSTSAMWVTGIYIYWSCNSLFRRLRDVFRDVSSRSLNHGARNAKASVRESNLHTVKTIFIEHNSFKNYSNFFWDVVEGESGKAIAKVSI